MYGLISWTLYSNFIASREIYKHVCHKNPWDVIYPETKAGWRSSCGVVVKLLACGVRGPGFDSWSRHYNFRDWLSSASKSRYGWKTCITKSEKQPTNQRRREILYISRILRNRGTNEITLTLHLFPLVLTPPPNLRHCLPLFAVA